MQDMSRNRVVLVVVLLLLSIVFTMMVWWNQGKLPIGYAILNPNTSPTTITTLVTSTTLPEDTITVSFDTKEVTTHKIESDYQNTTTMTRKVARIHDKSKHAFCEDCGIQSGGSSITLKKTTTTMNTHTSSSTTSTSTYTTTTTVMSVPEFPWLHDLLEKI